MQLIETEAGAHVWAEKYDGSTGRHLRPAGPHHRAGGGRAAALDPAGRDRAVKPQAPAGPDRLRLHDARLRHVWTLEQRGDRRPAWRCSTRRWTSIRTTRWRWRSPPGATRSSSVYTWVDDTAAARAKALALAEQAATYSANDPLILTVLGAVHTFARNYGTARVLLERAVAPRSELGVGLEPPRLARRLWRPAGGSARRISRRRCG